MRIPSVPKKDAAPGADPRLQSTPSVPAGPPAQPGAAVQAVNEIGGPAGPEPTRYGDWERNGRCIDF